MKAYEVIRELSKLPPEEEVIINWWTHIDITDESDTNLTWDEWKHLVRRIDGKEEWIEIFDLAIEEAADIVARREDLFKDKSG
jgi:hypothetical protein